MSQHGCRTSKYGHIAIQISNWLKTSMFVCLFVCCCFFAYSSTIISKLAEWAVFFTMTGSKTLFWKQVVSVAQFSLNTKSKGDNKRTREFTRLICKRGTFITWAGRRRWGPSLKKALCVIIYIYIYIYIYIHNLMLSLKCIRKLFIQSVVLSDDTGGRNYKNSQTTKEMPSYQNHW